MNDSKHVQVPKKRSVSATGNWFVNVYYMHILYLKDNLLERLTRICITELLDGRTEVETVTF